MRRLAEWQEFVETHRYPSFVIGVIAFGVLGNSAYDLAMLGFAQMPGWVTKPAGGAIPPLVLFAVALLLIPFLAFLFRLLDRHGGERQAADIVGPDRKMPPKRALIVFTSSGGNAFEDAIYRHRGGEDPDSGRLEYCWLLHSDDARSKAAARTAAEALSADGIRAKLVDVGDITNAETTLDALRRTVTEAYQIDSSNPITKDELVIDMTGGQRQQAAAAVIVCLNGDGLLEYMQGQYDTEGHLIQGLRSHAMFVPMGIEPEVMPEIDKAPFLEAHHAHDSQATSKIASA